MIYVLVAVGLGIVGYMFYADAQHPSGGQDLVAAVQGTGSATRLTPLADGLLQGQPAAPALAAARVPQAVPPSVQTPSTGGLLSPLEQQAAAKRFVEGHWQGMEVMELVPTLAREFNIPASQTGLLVDEVTLAAAQSGLRAGDLVYGVGGISVTTLRDFRDASYAMRNNESVQLSVMRDGRPGLVTLQANGPLGFAMLEGAPPILPGALSPHKEMGPCTDCHLIMASGGQLARDAGDLPPDPAPILAGATSPHADRGRCSACHKILKL